MRKQFIVILLIFIFSLFNISQIQKNTRAAGIIDIYTPSSGSTYYTGDILYIGWTYSDSGLYVKIELWKDGNDYYTISVNTTNDGSYSWTIPSSIYDSSYSFQIKITDLSDHTNNDFSQPFGIKSRSITVTSPDSSDTLYPGSSHTIRWSSNNAGSYVNIQLYKGSTFLSTITSLTRNNGYYTWTVTYDLSSGEDYRLVVASTSYSNVYDFSEYFIIGERKITITSPNGGEVWYRSGTYTITWTSGNAGSYVDMKLYKNGYYYSTISTYELNDGSYDWTISSSTSLDSYYSIRVQSKSYSNIYDTSNYFSIDERYINIASPSSGSIWFPNETQTITWSSKNAGDFVDIKLYKNNIYISTITSNAENNGNYDWDISNILGSNSNYRIKIRSKTYDDLLGQSNYFTIGKRTISITSPTDEEILEKGDTYTIKWDSENIGDFVDISLYQNGEFHSNIITGYYSPEKIYSGGSYIWLIPSDLSTDNTYQIKISSSTYSGVETITGGYIIIEDSLLQKIQGPIIIIFVFIVLIITTLVILKLRRKREIQNGGDIDNSLDLVESYGKNIETDISYDEYNNIWEKNNF